MMYFLRSMSNSMRRSDDLMEVGSLKKIGIMTIHTTYNYGAVLQAYATEAFYNSQGYDAELIDYTNDHIQEQLKLFYKQDGKFKGYFITFIRNTVFGRLHYYKKAFGNIKNTCRFSKRHYATLDALESTNYDVLVAGSDQLWNPLISGELDPAFFLQFGHCKKISVASSVGSSKLSDKELLTVKQYLKAFDAISVREEFARDQLQPLTDKEIKILLDPTLLLSREHWIQKVAIYSKYYSTKDKYIVTYFAGGNKDSHRQIIREYAEKFNLPVWTIQYSNYSWKESSKKILGASMEDFVALIAKASLVITDSFHGVAFSVNLGTDFVALTNKANPIRVKALLEKIGITERIDMPVDKYHSVDYDAVTPKLKALQEDSIDWAINAVNGMEHT